MGTLIDSSIFIAAERGDSALAASLARLDSSEEFFISSVTVFELLHGVYRADTSSRPSG